MESQEQHKKQYDWLKPHQFKPGQSGNPGGRPKGAKSIKTWLREHFEALDDEGKTEFLKNIDPKTAWEMAEGRPESKTDVTSKGEPITVQIVSFNEKGTDTA